MIGERCVHARKFDFRHVTGRAVFCADWTGRCTAALSFGVFSRRQVTRQALRVVIRCILPQLLVRIVTRQTTYPRIVSIVTTTVEYTIWLKANVVDSRLPR